MGDESRKGRGLEKVPALQAFDLDISGMVLHALPGLALRDLPWVFSADPVSDQRDPRILARFVAIDVAPTPPNIATSTPLSARRVQQFVADRRIWVVAGLLAADANGGPAAVTELSIAPFVDGDALPEIRAEDLRSIRLGRIRDGAMQRLRGYGQIAASEWGSEFFAGLGGVERFRTAAERAAGTGSTPLGRPPRPEQFYERIARLYLKLGEKGTRGILDQIAQQESKLQRREIPRETAREWVYRARQLGFLAPTKQGRANAAPGWRLLERTNDRKEKDGG